MDQARLNKLKFRAWRRGMRELDLIVGPFADARLATFDEAELAAFEKLLDAPDQDVLDWLIGRAAVPAAYDTAVFAALKAFAAEGLAIIPSSGADV